MIGPIIVALIPIVLLIGLGRILRQSAFLGEGFWPQAERLCYFVLLPCLFLHGLATADLSGVRIWGFAGALIVPTLLIAALLVLCARRITRDGKAFTSIFQGGIRFNNYVGVTAAIGLLGVQAVPLAAVANAVIVPTVNILCVLVFARFGAARPTLRGVLSGIAFNPLVLGCAGGVVLQASGLGLPVGVEGFVKALGQASLPLGLLCVGAALDLGTAGRGLRPALIASIAKFVAMPLATALACFTFGLDRQAVIIAVLFQALPTASSSYVMARQLGGDAALMAGIIAFQTLLGLLMVPLALVLLNLAL